MKKEQQQKLIYIMFGPFLAIMMLSSWLAVKFPDYVDYICIGLLVVAGLLYGLMVFMVVKGET